MQTLQVILIVDPRKCNCNVLSVILTKILLTRMLSTLNVTFPESIDTEIQNNTFYNLFQYSFKIIKTLQIFLKYQYMKQLDLKKY